MAVQLADLLERASTYLSDDRLEFVQQAYEFAAAQHEGQTRMSGEPYIEHPLNAALYLADLKQDSATLAATLLHDVVEAVRVKGGPQTCGGFVPEFVVANGLLERPG